VHQIIFNYALYKGPKTALFRLKKDGIDGKEYNDPFGKEEKGVLEDANKDWESLVGSFKSSAWDNELGHDKNITGSYVAGVNDPKKKDQNIQKKGNNMIIWVDCPGHCATDSAPTEGFTTAEQRIAVLIAAQGTEDKKPVKRKFWIHHKAKLVKDQWVPDGRPEIKIDPLEK